MPARAPIGKGAGGAQRRDSAASNDRGRHQGRHLKDALGVVGSAAAVGVVTMVIAVVALIALEETYGKNLDYVED